MQRGGVLKIRVIDLFCGCGGLSLGFDAYKGDLEFETVLGIDNEQSAIKIFNNNFNQSKSNNIKTGRVANVNWFTHPTEIQLYYLSHLAITNEERLLNKELKEIDFNKFLKELKRIDLDYEKSIDDLINKKSFQEKVSKVDKESGNIAIVRSSLHKLGIHSFTKPKINKSYIPWCQEYNNLDEDESMISSSYEENKEIYKSNEEQFNTIQRKFLEASLKIGTGQNRNNSNYLKKLSDFLDSDSGEKFKNLWIDWRSKRDTLRADYCIENFSILKKIYIKNRVHVILGGPPCKGFSRIGRPVIDSLRKQGIHAWSHKDFGDERNALMIQYVMFIEALEPDIFLFENVSNFTSELKTPSGKLNAPELLEEIIANLSTNDQRYHVSHKLINSTNYSVPQERKRFIMFGINAYKIKQDHEKELFQTSEFTEDVNLDIALWGLSEALEFSPSKGVKLDQKVSTYNIESTNMNNSLKEYWEWIRQKNPFTDQTVDLTDAHIYRKLRIDDKSFLKYVAPNIRWMDLKIRNSTSLNQIKSLLNEIKDASNDLSLNKKIDESLNNIDDSFLLKILLEDISIKFKLNENHLLEKNYLRNGHGRHGDWFERLSANKPSKTIVAHIGKDTYGYFHPYKERAITIRESARIQSFPDWFSFRSVGVVDAYTAIGNAVPPLVSNKFAQNIDKINSKYKIFDEETNVVPFIKEKNIQKELKIA